MNEAWKDKENCSWENFNIDTTIINCVKCNITHKIESILNDAPSIFEETNFIKVYEDGWCKGWAIVVHTTEIVLGTYWLCPSCADKQIFVGYLDVIQINENNLAIIKLHDIDNNFIKVFASFKYINYNDIHNQEYKAKLNYVAEGRIGDFNVIHIQPEHNTIAIYIYMLKEE